MAQNVKLAFTKPVYKSDASGDIVEVGDTVGLRLKQSASVGDGADYVDVTLTYVGDNGREIGWNRLAAGEDVRPTDVAAVDVDHNPVACP